jgi:hypothetical protein
VVKIRHLSPVYRANFQGTGRLPREPSVRFYPLARRCGQLQRDDARDSSLAVTLTMREERSGVWLQTCPIRPFKAPGSVTPLNVILVLSDNVIVVDPPVVDVVNPGP